VGVVEVGAVDTHPPCLVFFITKTGFASHLGCLVSLMNPTMISWFTSSPMARRHSLLKGQSEDGSLIGVDVEFVLSEFPRTPGMLDGFHAKMS
jgi:hypothetical protein